MADQRVADDRELRVPADLRVDPARRDAPRHEPADQRCAHEACKRRGDAHRHAEGVSGENRLGVEGGFQFGYDEETGAQVPGIGRADLELSQAEIYLGLRAELTDGPVRFFIVLGCTVIYTETRVRNGGDTGRQDSNDFGMYAQGGLEFDLTDTFFLGVNYRQTFDLSYDVDGTRFDGDYRQVTVSLGLSF